MSHLDVVPDEGQAVLDGLDLGPGHHGLTHDVPGAGPGALAVVRAAHQLLSDRGEGAPHIDMVTQGALAENRQVQTSS